jgi:hypothetical protein
MNTTKKVKRGGMFQRYRATQRKGQHQNSLTGILNRSRFNKKSQNKKPITPVKFEGDNFISVPADDSHFYITNEEGNIVYNTLSDNDKLFIDLFKMDSKKNARIMEKDGKMYIKQPTSKNEWYQLQQLQYIEPIIE